MKSSLPSSAELLGKIVTRMRLPITDDVAALRSRNAERFLAGETKPPSVGDAVIRCLAAALPQHGYLPTIGWPQELGFPSPSLLVGHAIRDLRERWDLVGVRLRGGALHDATLAPVTLTLARLVVIDLAVRAGAWLVITKAPPEESEPAPTLLTIAGAAESVLAESGLSAPALSDAIKIERTTIDAWRKGARPNENTLEYLAGFLAKKRTARDVIAVRRELRRALTVAEILRDLGCVDALRDEIDNLWETLWRFAAVVARRLANTALDDTSPDLTSLIMKGSAHPAASPLLSDLELVAAAPWRADLDAGSAWGDRLVFAVSVGLSAARVATTSVPAWLTPELIDAASQHMLGAPIPDLHRAPDGWQTITIKNPPPIAAEDRRLQARIARSRGQFQVSIDHLRRAVELVPAHADAHFELGVSLWQTGEIEQAIKACRDAAALRPDWELPLVEIGILLLNADRPVDARLHLEAVLTAASAPSTHLHYNLATARWQCNDFAGALLLFDSVLQDETYQSFAHALSQAAHCAFHVGDHDRGRDLAKRANDLGVSEAYRLWRLGAYRDR